MLCDDLEGWDGRRGAGRFKREGVYIWLIHTVVQHNTIKQLFSSFFKEQIENTNTFYKRTFRSELGSQ